MQISRFLHNCHKGITGMSLTKACCTLPPVESNYTPQGKESQLGDLTIYDVGQETSNRLLVCVYDIFGFHPVSKQFCDKLSASGFRVVMPDFFRGKPFPIENFPPKDVSEIMNFVGTTGSWENVLKKDISVVLEHYKALGANKFGTFGFCWGAKMCIEASVDFSNDIKSAVLIHPSFVGTDDGDKVKCPTLVLPSKDEADLIPFYEKVKQRFGEDGSGHVRFDDMQHGFCAARGDMNDENNRKRVDEALALGHNFFDKNLK